MVAMEVLVVEVVVELVILLDLEILLRLVPYKERMAV
tara:strand:+ start:99 stop:209 length:111 start_codon:yes stop_codon:yes gene_type:complete